ncbi:hypothetical protein [Gallibacterium anatis]|jgi:outer membrane murein-binding lipoprotein Lpp|uniref:Lipoprotein n=2 Tax=Gallibacterium anatis TaxID=750 RepID=F4HDY8_GALAU|nr:hypothetical protein [Gallibacterium anatis]AEC17949.1 hypothetical protein UMN179_01934 [Gallibacterium anatis UMN179]KGQ28076.1 hypothetical protein JP31_02855 [Gallibacterium anatis]KGQ28143.1 hypothetical protein JP27_03950 [Gallibacterium anatis]KGQ43238.1 hypothetical protein JP29_11045 [Gallibacterium anatis]KGQ45480.1 hypothetical protein JP28_00315 [Gallibacterium anatis]
MKLNKLFIATMVIASTALVGCAELKSNLQDIGQSAKDSAVTRAKMETNQKVSEATGKIFGSAY